MATIDATVGGADSNSYVTAAEADAYFDERLQSAHWTGEADADVKAQALIQATRRLDTFRFGGLKVAEGQALKWPRIEAYDDDGYEFDGIPTVVKHATFEAALWLLGANADGTDAFGKSGLEQFRRAKVGPLDVEMRHGHTQDQLPPHVMRILRPVLMSSGIMAELRRS
jgi:hypothetical protein